MEKNRRTKILTDKLQAICVGDVIYIDKRNLTTIRQMVDALSYQVPTAVTEYVSRVADFEGNSASYELCPRCDALINRTYQAYCDTCGQRLLWISQKKMIRRSAV